ncbi:hypothetical protein [Streptomyces sp. ISL-12]|nr:hypothetical protein [Streptomyces sp. ISL-12]
MEQVLVAAPDVGAGRALALFDDLLQSDEGRAEVGDRRGRADRRPR